MGHHALVQTMKNRVSQGLSNDQVNYLPTISHESNEEEPGMTITGILLSVAKLQQALLSRGDVCVRAAKMLALVQDEVGREGVRNARQTTLESWFVGHICKEVTMCEKW